MHVIHTHIIVFSINKIKYFQKAVYGLLLIELTMHLSSVNKINKVFNKSNKINVANYWELLKMMRFQKIWNLIKLIGILQLTHIIRDKLEFKLLGNQGKYTILRLYDNAELVHMLTTDDAKTSLAKYGIGKSTLTKITWDDLIKFAACTEICPGKIKTVKSLYRFS